MPKNPITCRTCGDPVDINGPDGVALIFRDSRDGKKTVLAAFCNKHVLEKPELIPFPELDELEG
jgi:hypothetical protein